MEQVLKEFKMRTQQKSRYQDIDLMRKNEDSDWTPSRRNGQNALWNMETDEYIWENPYYCWRYLIVYESIPCAVREWINEAKSIDNLNELREIINSRETILKNAKVQQLNGGSCII